jgi:hypothetical protein
MKIILVIPKTKEGRRTVFRRWKKFLNQVLRELISSQNSKQEETREYFVHLLIVLTLHHTEHLNLERTDFKESRKSCDSGKWVREKRQSSLLLTFDLTDDQKLSPFSNFWLYDDYSSWLSSTLIMQGLTHDSDKIWKWRDNKSSYTALLTWLLYVEPTIDFLFFANFAFVV